GYVVTLLEKADIADSSRIGGRVVLEPGSSIVWFTYPDRWHDIGRFHLRDGTFTGFYANILTPVVMEGLRWTTTDLFLDVWMDPEGGVETLDEDELDAAVAAGWVDATTSARARQEAADLVSAAERGAWPPPEVREWTLGRARESIPPRTERHEL